MLKEMLSGVGPSATLDHPLMPCLLQCLLDQPCLNGGVAEAEGLHQNVTSEHLDDNVLHLC